MSKDKSGRGVSNTTKRVESQVGGMMFLAEAMGPSGPSGAIERMEARGQEELVNADVLPVEGSDAPAFAAMGIKFGDPVAGDPLFRLATLPVGWRKVGTDHAMHSNLVDAKGRPRASIFYKAAFYDRRASMHPTRRFDWGRDYSQREHLQFQVVDRDNGRAVLFATEKVPAPPYSDRIFWSPEGTEGRLQREMEAWLDQHYPNRDDPNAYRD